MVRGPAIALMATSALGILGMLVSMAITTFLVLSGALDRMEEPALMVSKEGQIAIRFEKCAGIEPDPNGKVRYCISHVSAEGAGSGSADSRDGGA